jgi:hypothetical protein
MDKSVETDVSAEFVFELSQVDVLESYMTYIDTAGESVS